MEGEERVGGTRHSSVYVSDGNFVIQISMASHRLTYQDGPLSLPPGSRLIKKKLINLPPS